MEVTTDSPRAVTSQKMSLELLLSDVPETSYTLNSELDLWAKKLVDRQTALRRASSARRRRSHPAMSVNLDACIQCNRCVRACREEQVNDVIGYAFRGEHSKIVFDLDDPMGDSTCVACGECVQACPDRRADARARCRQDRPPTSRSIPCARIAASAASSLTTSRTTRLFMCRAGRPRELQPPVRERPLRLRLRPAQASAH